MLAKKVFFSFALLLPGRAVSLPLCPPLYHREEYEKKGPSPGR
jgi:hypothetical protein